ncbi:MAG: chaperone modulator CbpM [Ferruginibacter sp.]|nr:chaperone modulator CbpM [Ferruginibacter sp.]
MATQKLVAVKEFCRHHKIALEFIQDLNRNEIIELVMIKRTGFIAEEDLHSLEKAVRLYHDLDINIEGIQTILHLLSSLEKKENEINTLRNQLDFYVSAPG